MPSIAIAAVGALAALAALSRRGPRLRGSSARRAKVEGQEPSPEMKEIAETIRSTLKLQDVLVDPAGEVYLIGSASHLEGFLYQNDVRGDLVRGRNSYFVRDLLRRAGIHKGTIESYFENLTHWDGLTDAVSLYIMEALPPDLSSDGAWSVIAIPSPGGPQSVTWSAKERRLMAPKVVPPFRFCDQEPVPFGSPDGPVLLNLHEGSIPPLFLSHGVSFDGLDAAVECGGLLWPSMALSWRIPQSYGDVVFLADVSTVGKILKPSGSPSSMKYAYLAGTDIWSPTARDLTKREGEIQEQLEGRSERGLQSDFVYSTTKKADWNSLVGSWSHFGIDVSVTDRIATREKLVSTMRSILKTHTHGGDPYLYPEGRNRESMYDEKHRYPYAELKVVGKVLAGDLPVCLYPRQAARRVHLRLDKLGFHGFRVPFDWSGGPRKGWASPDADANRWAAAVTKALLKWAEAPCSTRGVQVGQALAPKEGVAEYKPMMSYSRAFRFTVGVGSFRSEVDLSGRCGPSGERGG